MTADTSKTTPTTAAPALTHLDTAATGLPPRRSLRAARDTLDGSEVRTVRAPACDAPVEAARASYAALVATGVPDGAEVVVANGEFTSIVFPFLAQAPRGVTVRRVPLAGLAQAVGPATALVAVSAVQSADGRRADLDAVGQACERDRRAAVRRHQEL